MNHIPLLPCPFCGDPAETDLSRGFMDYKGVPGNAVAIYCTTCEADMTLCYGDFPGDSPEHLLTILTAGWNRRQDITFLRTELELRNRECAMLRNQIDAVYEAANDAKTAAIQF